MPCPVCLGHRTAVHWRDTSGQLPRCYWRCGTCEATFLDPALRPEPDAERAYYQLHRNAPDDPAYRRYLTRLTAPLLARLRPGCEGLDYGCGPGPALAAMLHEAGHEVALYDPLFRPDTAVLARRYGFITCSEVAEHFHAPAAEFARLAGMLRPGGTLAVMTRLLDDGVDFSGWHYRRDPTHVVFYREATFHWLAARHGWHCDLPAPDVALLTRPADDGT
jgi:SAM-dependent methyltransferase